MAFTAVQNKFEQQNWK